MADTPIPADIEDLLYHLEEYVRQLEPDADIDVGTPPEWPEKLIPKAIAAIGTLSADRAAQAERMANLEEALRDLVDVVGLSHDSVEFAQRFIPSYLVARRALSQEGSE